MPATAADPVRTLTSTPLRGVVAPLTASLLFAVEGDGQRDGAESHRHPAAETARQVHPAVEPVPEGVVP